LGRASDVAVEGRTKEVEGVLGGKVPTSRVETFFVRFGDVFGQLVLGAAIVFSGLTVMTIVRQRLRERTAKTGQATT
jgi:hypothetical protein